MTLVERDYIIKLKAGSQDAFNYIYDTYFHRLYNHCYQYTKSREESQEIVHDLFLRLWKNRESLREDLPIVYLLFHMIRNSLINRFRSRVNCPVFEEYTNYRNSKRLSQNDTSMPIEYDDFCRQLDKMKNTLNKTQQQIIECKLEYDMSNKEMAEYLHLSEQTVKNQLSLAFKILREKLSTSYLFIVMVILFSFFWYEI